MPTLKYKDPASGTWVPLGVNGIGGPAGPPGNEVVVQPNDPGLPAGLDLWIDTDEVAPSASGTFLLPDDSVAFASGPTSYPQGMSLMNITLTGGLTTWPISPATVLTFLDGAYVLQMLIGQSNNYTILFRNWVATGTPAWSAFTPLNAAYIMTGTSFPTYAMPGALAFATDTGILYCYNSATASWSRVSRVGKQAYSAYGPAVDAQTTFTAFIDVPSLSVSWTADPLRLYRTTVIGLSDQQTNAANQTVAITDAANAIIRQTNQSAGINGFLSWNLPVTESGLSGVITRKARIFSTGATGRIRASTPNPFTILVEDIGAA